MKTTTTGLNILCAASFLYSIGAGMVITIIPIYSIKVGANQLELGIIVACYASAYLFAPPLIGRASDIFGRKSMLLCGMFGYSMAMLLFTVVHKPLELALVRILQGIVDLPYWVVPIALIADLYPSTELGTSLGKLSTSQYAGLSIGPLVAGALVEFLGFPWPFYICALIASLTVTIMYAAFRRKLLQPRAAPQHSEQTLLEENSRPSIVPYVGIVAGAICYGVVVSQLIVYATGILGRVLVVGALVTGYHLINALVQAPVGRLSDLIGRRYIIVFAFAMSALAFFLLTLTTTASTLFIATLLAGVSEGTLAVTLLTSVMDSAPSQRRGLYSGIQSMSWGLGYFLGPVISGFLAGYSSQMPFVFAGVVSLVMVPFMAARRTGTMRIGSASHAT
jgi:MFS family permease